VGLETERRALPVYGLLVERYREREREREGTQFLKLAPISNKKNVSDDIGHSGIVHIVHIGIVHIGHNGIGIGHYGIGIGIGQ
jgi:hypothetical protein